jgi:hypothetical protein
MQTFEGNLDHFDPNKPFVGDDRVPVQFYLGAVQDAEATEREGRPIFRDEDFIKIFLNKDEVLDRPVRDTDKARWPRQYQAWKQTGNNRPGMMGMPLEKWPAVTRAQAEELAYFKVFTVEQLADLPDTTVQQVAGLQKLKNLARAHMDIARGEAPVRRMQAELEQRDATIAGLQAQIADLAQRLESVVERKTLV